MKFKNYSTEILVKEFATRIRENMSCIVNPILYSSYDINSDYHREQFNIVKETCVLINELLSFADVKNKIIDMAVSTTTDIHNKSDVNAKYDTFGMLRNLFIHFPIFNSWNEVYINKQLLTWNNPKNSSILNYFKKYHGKRLVYNIYTKYQEEDDWHIGCTIDIAIPNDIPEEEKLYLNDFMSFDDVLRTFCIIDYYLDYLGFDLIQYQYLSI